MTELWLWSVSSGKLGTNSVCLTESLLPSRAHPHCHLTCRMSAEALPHLQRRRCAQHAAAGQDTAAGADGVSHTALGAAAGGGRTARRLHLPTRRRRGRQELFQVPQPMHAAKFLPPIFGASSDAHGSVSLSPYTWHKTFNCREGPSAGASWCRAAAVCSAGPVGDLLQPSCCSREFIRAAYGDPYQPVPSPTYLLQNIYDDLQGDTWPWPPVCHMVIVPDAS